MSSGLQLDVRHHIQWRRHLVNAYEVKAGIVFFAGWKLCDPCLSALRWFVYHARCYTSVLLFSKLNWPGWWFHPSLWVDHNHIGCNQRHMETRLRMGGGYIQRQFTCQRWSSILEITRQCHYGRPLLTYHITYNVLQLFYSALYRVAQLKWGQLTYLMVTSECIHKIQ